MLICLASIMVFVDLAGIHLFTCKTGMIHPEIDFLLLTAKISTGKSKIWNNGQNRELAYGTQYARDLDRTPLRDGIDRFLAFFIDTFCKSLMIARFNKTNFIPTHRTVPQTFLHEHNYCEKQFYLKSKKFRLFKGILSGTGMATTTQINHQIQIPRLAIEKSRRVTLAEQLENYVLRNFGKYFNQVLHDYGLETETPILLNRTYEMLLDFHTADHTRPISSKFLKAAGARTIQEMCLRGNQHYDFREICRQLKITMRPLACFPSIPRHIQIKMIFESIAEIFSAQVLTKAKSYVDIFFKKITYPNALVGIALYHAGVSCQEELGLSTLAKIVNVSASTLYILRNKFPTLS